MKDFPGVPFPPQDGGSAAAAGIHRPVDRSGPVVLEQTHGCLLGFQKAFDVSQLEAFHLDGFEVGLNRLADRRLADVRRFVAEKINGLVTDPIQRSG